MERFAPLLDQIAQALGLPNGTGHTALAVARRVQFRIGQARIQIPTLGREYWKARRTGRC